MQRVILAVVCVCFAMLTGVALSRHGFWGIVEPHFRSYGAGQVFADLVIALSLNLMWIAREVRAAGARFWPWLILTLAAGSFGPLLYLLFRDRPTAGADRAASPAK
jgi:hypothetical protein